MRALVAAAVVIFTGPAAAETLPSGALGIVGGVPAGTGADAKLMGVGYQYGLQASWQPTSTDRSLGYTIRWATLIGSLYNASAAQVEDTLSTVTMDLTVGVRFRPWATPRRYLTARAGASLLRANEPIPDSDDPSAEMRRAFVGAIGVVGFDQYLGSVGLFSVDVRYGLIGDGPSQISLLVGFGVVGP
jgi:hypothetical protein